MKLFNKSLHKVLMAFICVSTLLVGCSTTEDYKPGDLSLGFTVSTYSYPTFFSGVDKAPLPLDVVINKEPTSPVTLNYTITSSTGAVQGVQYEDPNNGSVTIQPGQGRYVTIDAVNLLTSGYTGENDGRRDSYEITINSSSQDVAIGSIGKKSTVANVFSQCVFNIDEFVGTATIEDSFTPDTYEVQISKVNETTLRLTGFFPSEGEGYYWDFSVEPRSGTATVPFRVFTNDLLFETPYSAWAVAGSGTFDICNRRLTLNLTHTVDAGSFGGASHVITWP